MRTKSIGHRWTEWPYFGNPGTSTWYCAVCGKRRYWWRLVGTCYREVDR